MDYLRAMWLPRAQQIAIALLAGVIGGCASTGQAARDSQRRPSAGIAPDVDVTRAFVPLSQIEARPVRPVRPESLQPLSDRASRQIVQARRLVSEQRYTEAAIELERALRYDPNHPTIHRTLALLHWEAGNVERARTHAQRTLDVNPDDAASHYVLARCLTIDDNRSGAIYEYRTALVCSDFEKDPEIVALTHYHLAVALEKEGYEEAALGQYEAFAKRVAALAAPPRAPAELATLMIPRGAPASEARARILERLGRFTEAASALEPAFVAAPDDVARGIRYARLLMKAGNYDSALSVVRRIPTDDTQVIELLSAIHEASGHPEEVVADLEARIAQAPDPLKLVPRLADVLVRLGQPARARDVLRQTLEEHADAGGVRGKLLDVLIATEAWTDAIDVAAQGVALDPEWLPSVQDKFSMLASNEQAVRFILAESAQARTPYAAATAYLRGFVAREARRNDEAEKSLRASLSENPGFVPARIALAELLRDQYRYDEALAVAEGEGADVPDDARLERVLGEIFERLDDYEQAKQHLKAAIHRDRTDTEAMLLLAKVHRASGERLQAQRQLRVLLDFDPDHEEAREQLAFLYMDDGKFDVAVEQFKELERRAQSPTTKARCAALLEQMHDRDPQAYRKKLMDAMDERGEDAATWMAVAQSYDPIREVDQQIEAVRNAHRLDPDDEDAVRALVDASKRALEFENAAAMLEQLLRRRPNRHAWTLDLIDVLWTVQDYEKASAIARNAAGSAGLSEQWRVRFRLALLETYRLADQDERIRSQLKEWIAEDSNETDGTTAANSPWLMKLAETYVRDDQIPLAVEIYERRLQEDPSDGGALMALLEALVAGKQYDRASQYVLDRLRDDPENDAVLRVLIRVLADAGRVDDALELIRNRLFHTRERERLQNLQLLVLVGQKRYEESAEFVEAMLDEVFTLLQGAHEGHLIPLDGEIRHDRLIRMPDEPLTLERLAGRLTALRLQLATVLLQAGEYVSAEEQLSTWLETASGPSERLEYLLRLSACYRFLSDEDRATEVLARAWLLNPNDPTLSNDVAYGWIDQGVQLDDAEPMIRLALAQNPRQAAYLDTFGWLQYKKGAFEESTKWLRRAKRARSSADPVILDHLGDAFWRLGRSSEAIGHWEQAVQAVLGKPADEVVAADERRVRDQTPAKIEAARTGASPKVSAIASDSD